MSEQTIEATNKVREAVGVFNNLDEMQAAIDELELQGFERRHISVLGSEGAVEEHFGQPHIKPEELEDNPETPRSIKVKPQELGIAQGALVGGTMYAGVVAAILAAGAFTPPGALVTTAIMGGVGGAALGGLLAKLLGDEYANFFQKQLDAGGLLLWVATPDLEKEQIARDTLTKHGARDVHVHDITLVE
ncbi:MAG: hypothetical protein K0R63_820 [Rickettsiales bacterium]|jgi:hypothetical protein|nr:hypothetical protein [Rickettsiales bacterium]